MASGSHAGRRKFETSTIKERAEEYFPEMVEIRRDIHRHPEIGRNEVRTSALIRKKLEEYGVDAIERRQVLFFKTEHRNSTKQFTS